MCSEEVEVQDLHCAGPELRTRGLRLRGSGRHSLAGAGRPSKGASLSFVDAGRTPVGRWGQNLGVVAPVMNSAGVPDTTSSPRTMRVVTHPPFEERVKTQMDNQPGVSWNRKVWNLFRCCFRTCYESVLSKLSPRKLPVDNKLCTPRRPPNMNPAQSSGATRHPSSLAASYVCPR